MDRVVRASVVYTRDMGKARKTGRVCRPCAVRPVGGGGGGELDVAPSAKAMYMYLGPKKVPVEEPVEMKKQFVTELVQGGYYVSEKNESLQQIIMCVKVTPNIAWTSYDIIRIFAHEETETDATEMKVLRVMPRSSPITDEKMYKLTDEFLRACDKDDWRLQLTAKIQIDALFKSPEKTIGKSYSNALKLEQKMKEKRTTDLTANIIIFAASLNDIPTMKIADVTNAMSTVDMNALTIQESETKSNQLSAFEQVKLDVLNLQIDYLHGEMAESLMMAQIEQKLSEHVIEWQKKISDYVAKYDNVISQVVEAWAKKDATPTDVKDVAGDEGSVAGDDSSFHTGDETGEDSEDGGEDSPVAAGSEHGDHDSPVAAGSEHGGEDSPGDEDSSIAAGSEHGGEGSPVATDPEHRDDDSLVVADTGHVAVNVEPMSVASEDVDLANSFLNTEPSEPLVDVPSKPVTPGQLYTDPSNPSNKLMLCVSWNDSNASCEMTVIAKKNDGPIESSVQVFTDTDIDTLHQLSSEDMKHYKDLIAAYIAKEVVDVSSNDDVIAEIADIRTELQTQITTDVTVRIKQNFDNDDVKGEIFDGVWNNKKTGLQSSTDIYETFKSDLDDIGNQNKTTIKPEYERAVISDFDWFQRGKTVHDFIDTYRNQLSNDLFYLKLKYSNAVDLYEQALNQYIDTTTMEIAEDVAVDAEHKAKEYLAEAKQNRQQAQTYNNEAAASAASDYSNVDCIAASEEASAAQKRATASLSAAENAANAANHALEDTKVAASKQHAVYSSKEAIKHAALARTATSNSKQHAADAKTYAMITAGLVANAEMAKHCANAKFSAEESAQLAEKASTDAEPYISVAAVGTAVNDVETANVTAMEAKDKAEQAQIAVAGDVKVVTDGILVYPLVEKLTDALEKVKNAKEQCEGAAATAAQSRTQAATALARLAAAVTAAKAAAAEEEASNRRRLQADAEAKDSVSSGIVTAPPTPAGEVEPVPVEQYSKNAADYEPMTDAEMERIYGDSGDVTQKKYLHFTQKKLTEEGPKTKLWLYDSNTPCRIDAFLNPNTTSNRGKTVKIKIFLLDDNVEKTLAASKFRLAKKTKTQTPGSAAAAAVTTPPPGAATVGEGGAAGDKVVTTPPPDGVAGASNFDSDYVIQKIETSEEFEQNKGMMQKFIDYHSKTLKRGNYNEKTIDKMKDLVLDSNKNSWIYICKYKAGDSEKVVGFVQIDQFIYDKNNETMDLDKVWMEPKFRHVVGLSEYFVKTCIKKCMQETKQGNVTFNKVHAIVVHGNEAALRFFMLKIGLQHSLYQEIIQCITGYERLETDAQMRRETDEEGKDVDVKTAKITYMKFFNDSLSQMVNDNVEGTDYSLAAEIVKDDKGDIKFKSIAKSEYDSFLNFVTRHENHGIDKTKLKKCFVSAKKWNAIEKITSAQSTMTELGMQRIQKYQSNQKLIEETKKENERLVKMTDDMTDILNKVKKQWKSLSG